jgi:hypothetical protein
LSLIILRNSPGRIYTELTRASSVDQDVVADQSKKIAT